jgi:hypothetical protein
VSAGSEVDGTCAPIADGSACRDGTCRDGGCEPGEDSATAASGSGATAGTGTTSGGVTTTGSGTSADAGGSSSIGGDDEGLDDGGSDDGCGCRLVGSSEREGAAISLALLGLGLIAARRRRPGGTDGPAGLCRRGATP